MAFDFTLFGPGRLSEAFVQWLITEQWPDQDNHYSRLWDYYQTPTTPIATAVAKQSESARSYIQAQEMGLPSRITGVVYSARDGILAGKVLSDIQRKEVVIENDIAWRINAMVDFLFGKEIKIISRSPDAARRRDIEQILKAVFDANGGIGLFQDMAVLGSVYGFVDCIVRPGPAILARLAGSPPIDSSSPLSHGVQSVLHHAETIDLELIDAPRALPVLEENDCRKIRYYIQHFYQAKHLIARDTHSLPPFLRDTASRRQTVAVTEIIGPDGWQRYEDGNKVAQSVNPMGFVPVVHIQNIAQPLFYEGISDVAQLVALQDELNTRLSDRASRLTMQAFKMYLVKGIDVVTDKPIAPGRMWCTDNPDASIEAFGGDQAMPSENMHIAEIREAMDKISGVTPVVAGVLKNKLGNLTSGVALKLTFMGTLARTARKQFTYGRGIRQIGQMVLDILDKAGLYHTDPQDRILDIEFPNPLPQDEWDKLRQAQLKSQLPEIPAPIEQKVQ